MKRSTDRILVTHQGTLPRPDDLRDMLSARSSGRPYDKAGLDERIRRAVQEDVQQQVGCGIDVVNDGEMSKTSFNDYVSARLHGLAPTAEPYVSPINGRDMREFSEYFASRRGFGNRQALGYRRAVFQCVAPLTYIGQNAVQMDIANLKAALAAVNVEEAYLPAVVPGSIAHWLKNAYYANEEEFLYAIADAMHEEYKAIVDAGVLLQIDDPDLAEDYCSADPDRLLGLGVIPMTNLQDALAELEHIHKLGLKGAMLGIFPSGKGHPTPEDDAFWKAALDMQMPLCVHQEFNREGPRGGALLRYPRQLDNKAGRLGPLTDLVAQVARFGRLGFVNGVQMALDGVFERFPTLRLFFAETQIGWIPWAYEMADIRYERHRHWAEEVLGWQPLPKRPTDYLKEHILWGFQQDSVGVRLRDLMGVDRLIWATDFPHQESEYPHSHSVVERNFTGVPADETYQMIAGNVIKFFHLETSPE